MSPTVLVVDDEADIRESLRVILELEGYKVYSAANGVEALALIEDGIVPSVILLDLMMPVMNGVDFLAILRQRPRFAECPVLVVTACRQIAQELRARRLPVQALIEKPAEIDHLLSILRCSCVQWPVQNDSPG
jgi:CheY-like chemotaxis protein